MFTKQYDSWTLTENGGVWYAERFTKPFEGRHVRGPFTSEGEACNTLNLGPVREFDNAR